MHTGAGDEEGVNREVTRRNVLKGGLTTGLGLGATTLMGAEVIFMPHVTGCLPSPMPGRGT